jgi:hypothetical protein
MYISNHCYPKGQRMSRIGKRRDYSKGRKETREESALPLWAEQHLKMIEALGAKHE